MRTNIIETPKIHTNVNKLSLAVLSQTFFNGAVAAIADFEYT